MKKVLDYLIYRAVWGIAFLLAKLPARLTLEIGKIGGICCYYVSRRRRVAYADLKAAFGARFDAKQRWQIVRKHFCHLGQTAMEIIRFPFMDSSFIEQSVVLHNWDRFESGIEENKGVVFLTAHFGNWELMQIVSGILGKPIHVLARAQKFSVFDQLLNQLRESHGSIAVIRGIGIRNLYRALQRKELVGLLGDQDAGKQGGLILPLFGRKTTVPTGAFELARRTGAPVLPCFIIRRTDSKHEIFMGEPIRCGEGKYQMEDLAPYVKAYVSLLENMVCQYPDQWLWGSKRWKHTWTKRILMLSDGKPGHVKQSEALVAQLKTLETQYGRPGMEYPVKTISVAFKSRVHKKIFPWFAFIMMPWIQGRMAWFRFFFTPETQKNLVEASADFVVSSGSSLIPLNLCLSRESRAKSVVMMKPSFPFNLFRFDLAVIPAHDLGHMPKGTFRTLLTPNVMDLDWLGYSADVLKKELRDPTRVKFAVFIGGNTRAYEMDLAGIEKVISALDRISAYAGDYVVTTSRRTPDNICRFLKSKSPLLSGCQLLVMGAEDKRREVAPGMMMLAEILVVTEDSISMISEAVTSGKKVMVLSFQNKDLPAKHKRFQQILAERSSVVVATPVDFGEKLLVLDRQMQVPDVAAADYQALGKRLQEIL